MNGEATKDIGNGLGEPAAEAMRDGELSGTGGSAGSGALSGEGEISGERGDGAPLGDGDELAPGAQNRAALSQLAGRTGNEVAAEAAALGGADGSLADAAGIGGPGGRTVGDSLGSEGRDIGSGTPGDRGELGGAGPLGQHGGAGPGGAASPGCDTRD